MWDLVLSVVVDAAADLVFRVISTSAFCMVAGTIAVVAGTLMLCQSDVPRALSLAMIVTGFVSGLFGYRRTGR